MKTQRFFSFALLVSTALLFSFCKREKTIYTVSDSAMVPKLPDQVMDYPVSSNDYLATLGRVLFYDKEMSQNRNVSCGSCHKQSNAFTDGQQFSKGTNDEMGTRNAPSIFPKNGRLFWDGRATSIMDLVLRPVRNKAEMNVSDVGSLMDRISSLDYYTYMFKHAFPGATVVDSNMIKSALTEFLRNFTFTNTKFARSQRGEVALTSSEQLGKNLFFGTKAKCSSCHHVDDGTNTNNVGGNGYGSTNESHNIGLDLESKDLGVGGVTKNDFENGAFMMPVLLNVEYTAPYMHDGRFKTLEEVVDHYNSKIENAANLDPILKDFTSGFGSSAIKMNLTDAEKAGLVAFLKTLTDPTIMTDAKYSDPFVPRN